MSLYFNGFDRQYVSIDLDNGLTPTGDKPLCESMVRALVDRHLWLTPGLYELSLVDIDHQLAIYLRGKITDFTLSRFES